MGDLYWGRVTNSIDVIKEVRTRHVPAEASFNTPRTGKSAASFTASGSTIRRTQTGEHASSREYVLLIKSRIVLAGPVVLPVDKVSQDEHLDFETKLAILIMKDALNVSEDEAMDYVLGFRASNDLSSRKFQLNKGGGQW